MAKLKIAKREFHDETVIGHLHKDEHSTGDRWFIKALDSQYYSRIDIKTLKDYHATI